MGSDSISGLSSPYRVIIQPYLCVLFVKINELITLQIASFLLNFCFDTDGFFNHVVAFVRCIVLW
jgi:hypothetical protein